MSDLPTTSGATVTYTMRAVFPTLNHERLAEARQQRQRQRAAKKAHRGMTLNEVKERYLPNRNKEDLDKPATSTGVESED